MFSLFPFFSLCLPPSFLYRNSVEKEDLSWKVLFAGISLLKLTSLQEPYEEGTILVSLLPEEIFVIKRESQDLNSSRLTPEPMLLATPAFYTEKKGELNCQFEFVGRIIDGPLPPQISTPNFRNL